jgi:Fur family ferric uptake transcriptional regulator
MLFTERKASSILRKNRYKLTPQRKAILTTIANSRDHLTPAQIYDRVRESNPNIGLVTVYRTLNALSKLGLLCEVHSEGNCHSYLMRRAREHHHHLVCSDCGMVTDFTDCDLSGLEQRLSRETGFQIKGHLLEFSGRCSSCQ